MTDFRGTEITAIDLHAAGAHGRVVLGGVGVLDVPGATMFEKMLYFERHADAFRRLMLREPRGFMSACVNVVFPSAIPGVDAGFVIMEQPDYYPAMSGGNTMCVVTALLETGFLPMTEPITRLQLETPAGVIGVRAACANGKVLGVTLRNVPSFAVSLDLPIEVAGVGTIPVDIAYGGMFYAHVEAAALGVEIAPEHGEEIVEKGLSVLAAVRERVSPVHPENPAINIIENVLLWAPPKDPANSARNAVVLSHGQIDRCPCGTGTSSRVAVLHKKGALKIGEPFLNEGILSTVFTGRAVEEVRVGDADAVVVEITGRAWITGRSTYILAADDPFPEGFAVGDAWPAIFGRQGVAPLSADSR